MMLVVCALLAAATASHTLTPAHLRILNAWLHENPTYRRATNSDSTCPDKIDQIRWQYGSRPRRPVRDYHPYQVVGDFNGDGHLDFAVVLLDASRRADRFLVAVFNGPFQKTKVSPSFVAAGLNLACGGLFFGPPRPKPYRLLVGPFESDSRGLLVPEGHTYRWEKNK
jgi:hypothetical protein